MSEGMELGSIVRLGIRGTARIESQVNVGTPFAVCLESLAASGYVWSIQTPWREGTGVRDCGVAALTDDAVGGTGFHAFVITPECPGRHYVTLAQGRPFEDDPTRVATLSIELHAV